MATKKYVPTSPHRQALLENLGKANEARRLKRACYAGAPWLAPPRRPEAPYKLTPRRLRAARAALRKANLARKLRHYPRRVTPRLRAAALQNLRQANAARAAGPVYFRHGLYSASEPRRLAGRGENRAALETHLELFARAFARSPEAAQGVEAAESLLARSAAELLWRRWRALRALARWQSRRLGHVLARACLARPETLEGAVDVALNVREVFYRCAEIFEPLQRLNARLVEVFFKLIGPRPGKEPRRRPKREKPPVFEGIDIAMMTNPLLSARRAGAVRKESEAAEGSSLRARAEQSAETSAVGRSVSTGAPVLRRLEELVHLFRNAFGSPGSSTTRDVREQIVVVAEAAWKRLEIFPRRAQREAREVRKKLEAALGAVPLPPETAETLAREILEVFWDDSRLLVSVSRQNERLKQALNELLKRRYGGGPEEDYFAAPQT